MSKPQWTEAEREAFGNLLDMFGEQLSNSGCNDFNLPETESGQKLADDVAKWIAKDQGEEPELPGRLCVDDWILLHVLRERLGLERKP